MDSQSGQPSPRPINAAAYVRVSTDNQVGEDRFGLEAQREAIRSYATENGFDVEHWFCDEGHSGATVDRPGLQDLLSLAPGSNIQTVIVAKMDRIARDLFIQLWLEKELRVHGVEVISVAEPFRGDDPMTVAFRQMVGVFAELEKHRIKDRLSAGRKEKARQGGYAGGGVPLGYRTVRGEKEIRLDCDKAATVVRLYELRREHPAWQLEDIAAALNEEGHTTATGRPFSKVQVWRVLRREEFYRGRYRYSGVEAEGRHPAILGEGRGDEEAE